MDCPTDRVVVPDLNITFASLETILQSQDTIHSYTHRLVSWIRMMWFQSMCCVLLMFLSVPMLRVAMVVAPAVIVEVVVDSER